MPSAFLGLNGLSAGTGTPQVRRYNGLSATVVGATFGASSTVTITSNSPEF